MIFRYKRYSAVDLFTGFARWEYVTLDTVAEALELREMLYTYDTVYRMANKEAKLQGNFNGKWKTIKNQSKPATGINISKEWNNKTADELRAIYEEKTAEDMAVIAQLQEENAELKSLSLWALRRLNKAHKKFAYDEYDKITGEQSERE